MAKKKKTKTSRKCWAPVYWSTLSEVQRFNRVFAIFKSVTAGGADGSIKGVNGSINAVSTKLILDSLRVKGGVVCDLGAADGKFMICAFLAGARRVLGVEFAENIGYKMVLEAVVRRLKQEYGIEFNLDWIGSAIEDVRIFSSLSLVFRYQCTQTPLLGPFLSADCTSSRRAIIRFRLLEWHVAYHPELRPGALRKDFVGRQYCRVLQHELDLSRRWYGSSNPFCVVNVVMT
jgi:hypothetical protein